jgi:hypothetical protein
MNIWAPPRGGISRAWLRRYKEAVRAYALEHPELSERQVYEGVNNTKIDDQLDPTPGTAWKAARWLEADDAAFAAASPQGRA